ncbi:hypothetical protein FOMPIDRAFT_1018503 [Fomitopsis schrenkii]|uniref:Uncharacterized protein n=1 Tax=Fomitopsis schrenkii TaxID=2126942 RepID=S8DV48_FOMSC|nr:hypothetical protein FOMPIDRAFT_1018503 [Fomitopsis schrenkii]
MSDRHRTECIEGLLNKDSTVCIFQEVQQIIKREVDSCELSMRKMSVIGVGSAHLVPDISATQASPPQRTTHPIAPRRDTYQNSWDAAQDVAELIAGNHENAIEIGFSQGLHMRNRYGQQATTGTGVRSNIHSLMWEGILTQMGVERNQPIMSMGCKVVEHTQASARISASSLCGSGHLPQVDLNSPIETAHRDDYPKPLRVLNYYRVIVASHERPELFVASLKARQR